MKPLFAYHQANYVRLDCKIHIDQLFETEKERAIFDKKWIEFFRSDSCNKTVYKKQKKQLIYHSENLIPVKKDNRAPLLLVFGNPASHSVATSMFFAFTEKGKENRFWKSILKPAGILNFSFNGNQSAEILNALRKKQLLSLDYESPFRIGLCVFISMPSAPGGPWGGVAGIRKLIGAKALRRLETEESKRIIKYTERFIGDDPRGKIVIFQKNAWEGLRSENDPEYTIEKTKLSILKGHLRDCPSIPIVCVPPTRLSGPCRRILRNNLIF